tara:strand:+ start:48 stop:1211 length:1164 start_codon:yes stop_codon:yes gene_type:complete
MIKKQNICIIGGSLSGLTTAITLSKLNCNIDLITGNFNQNFDSSRTIAISESNLTFLKKLNIFKFPNKNFWPCSGFKLYEENEYKKISEIFDMQDDLKQKKVFHMVKNSELIKLLMQKINNSNSISIKKHKINEIFTSGFLKGIKYKNQKYKYNLIIVCTGNDSKIVKNIFPNQFIENSYNETSIVTIINHEKVKNNTARQIFMNDEIFALLPLSSSQTSIVWTIKNNKYTNDKLILKEKIKFYAKNFFKKITFDSKIENKSLNFLIRNKYFEDRILLFGDSLHVVHPLTGQGFNMILRDLDSLVKKISNKLDLGLDIGSENILSEFSLETKPRNFAYSIGIDLIKNSFSIKNKFLGKLRNNVLKSVNKNNFAKKMIFNVADKGLRF